MCNSFGSTLPGVFHDIYLRSYHVYMETLEALTHGGQKQTPYPGN